MSSKTNDEPHGVIDKSFRKAFKLKFLILPESIALTVDLGSLCFLQPIKFLSRLNEMSGGRENMCLVSGSLRRILKSLRMAFSIARFCGW